MLPARLEMPGAACYDLEHHHQRGCLGHFVVHMQVELIACPKQTAQRFILVSSTEVYFSSIEA